MGFVASVCQPFTLSARRITQTFDEEKGPRIVFADGTESNLIVVLSPLVKQNAFHFIPRLFAHVPPDYFENWSRSWLRLLSYTGWKWAKWPDGNVGWLPADVKLPSNFKPTSLATG